MNLPTKSLPALGFGLALILTASARAQATSDGTPPAPTTATSSNLPSPDMSTPASSTGMDMDANGKIHHGDKEFILAVAEGSNQEIALSQLATTNADRQDVKDFAQMMIRDHGLLNAQLADLAASKGVDIADAVAKGQKKGVESLAKKQGADFDKAYLRDMVSGHDKTLKAFTKESDKGKDADVRAFASKNLPTIQMHDDHAHGLQQGAM
jgi:putative membrane protein